MHPSIIKGIQYLQGGNTEEAISLLEHAIVENRYLWDAYYYLSKAYLEHTKDSQSQEDLRKSLQALHTLEHLNPHYFPQKVGVLKKELEASFAKMGLTMADEVGIAQSAINGDPTEANAHSRLAHLLGEGPGTRIMRFQKIVETDPANILALSQLARAYSETNDLLMAQKLYQKILFHALGLHLTETFWEHEPMDRIQEAVRWWSDQEGQGFHAEKESMELIFSFHSLSKIFSQQGELKKAAILFAGAIDLAINLGALTVLQHLFNDFLDLCIQSGQYTLARNRLAFLEKEVDQSNQEKLLDPLLVSLVRSHQQEETS